MPELQEMLQDLRDMVADGELYYDDCEHTEPARPEASPEDDFCPVCFVMNLWANVSLDEPEFTEETTERQRETIQSLWDQWCN